MTDDARHDEVPIGVHADGQPASWRMPEAGIDRDFNLLSEVLLGKTVPSWHCEIANRFMSGDDFAPHGIKPPCTVPASHRYRPTDPADPNWFNGRWRYRCETHLRWLTDEIDWEIVPVNSCGREERS